MENRAVAYRFLSGEGTAVQTSDRGSWGCAQAGIVGKQTLRAQGAAEEDWLLI